MVRYRMKNKQCSKCGKNKPATTEYFRVHSQKRDGLRPDCKECQANDWKVKYPSIADKHRERNREYRLNNLEKINKYHSEYYDKNKKTLRAYSREYAKKNIFNTKMNKKHYKANTKAKMYGLKNDLTIGQIKILFALHDGTCKYCHENVGNLNLTIDHVVPMSKGGANTISNIVPCCMKCNTIKGEKDVKSFMEYLNG